MNYSDAMVLYTTQAPIAPTCADLRSMLQVCVPLLHALVHPAVLHTLLLHLLTATSQFLSTLLQVLSLQGQLLYLRSTHTNTHLSFRIHIWLQLNKAITIINLI